jgi:uncharacterized protein
MGEALYYGKGIPQDYSQAIVWYEKAALQNNVEAEYSLGYMYRFGQGVPLSYPLAASWLTSAATAGYAPAQSELASLF